MAATATTVSRGLGQITVGLGTVVEEPVDDGGHADASHIHRTDSNDALAPNEGLPKEAVRIAVQSAPADSLGPEFAEPEPPGPTAVEIETGAGAGGDAVDESAEKVPEGSTSEHLTEIDVEHSATERVPTPHQIVEHSSGCIQ